MQGHLSFIQFRLDYTLGGNPGSDTVTSGGFDKGRIAGGSFHPSINEDTQTATGWAVGDTDATGWKLVAQRNSAVSELTVDGKATTSGRTLDPASVGTLVSGLALGDIVHFGWKAVGESNGPFGFTSVSFLKVAPLLEKATETEDGINGTFGVTADDPGAQASALDYRTRQGDGAFSAWADAVGGSAAPNDGQEYQKTVALVDGHLSYIEFRMTYVLRGRTQTVIAKSSGFDKGRVPGGDLTILVDGSRNASAVCVGDFDTAKWKVGASKVNAAAALTAANAAGYTAGRVITRADLGTLLSSVIFGDTLYVAGIPVAGDNSVGPTVAKELYYAIARPPTWRIVTQTEDGSNGTFRVELNDPDGAVTVVQSRKKIGPAAFTAYATESPASGVEYEELVGLIEHHFSYVEMRATYVIDGGTFYSTISSAGFDPGQIPNILNISTRFDTTGMLDVTVNCDSDTDRFWVYVHTSAFQNRAATKLGTLVTSNQGTVTFPNGTSTPSSGTYDPGQEVFVTVVGRNDTTTQESTNVVEHKDQNTGSGGGELGNYVKGNIRWIKKGDTHWGIEGDMEYGFDTTSLVITYTSQSDGSTLISADTISGLTGGGVVTIQVKSSGVLVGWADGDYAPQIHVDPVAGSVSGTTKVYQLAAPSSAAEGSIRVTTTAGVSSISSSLEARDNYGVEITFDSSVAHLEVKSSDFVTVSAADPSGTPNNSAEPALWLKV